MAAMLPRIVATDLDGTLLRSDGTLSERTRATLLAVQAAGTRVVLCTARPVRWVRPIAAAAGIEGCAVCANGAVTWDFDAEAMVTEDAIAPDVAEAVVAAVGELFPGGAWAVEHAAGFGHEAAYEPHWPVPAGTAVAPVRELLGFPPLKLLFRHPDHSPDEMLIAARSALGAAAEVSHSNSADGLLEISAPGIDKGAGLARLCATLGAGPADVVAFGDMPNDLALLRFAGHAVAVANAHPEVLAMADELTLSNDEDGVAAVLERRLDAVHRPLGGRVPAGRGGRAPQLVFATAARMPIPDPETHLVVDLLAEAGVHAEIHPWNEPYAFGAAPLVVGRTTWDYVADVGAFADWIRAVDAETELENPAALMLWNLHKAYLVELAEAGVPVVTTRLLAPGSGPAERAAALEGLEEVVIKPAVSGGARGTMRVDAADPAAAAHLDALLRDGEALVQPFEAEIARGETSLVYLGGELSHAIRKTPADHDWRVQVQYGGVNAAHIPTDAELAAGAAALAALPVAPLYARIDLVGAGRPRLMEAELIEPQLFLPYAPGAAERYAAVLLARLAAKVN